MRHARLNRVPAEAAHDRPFRPRWRTAAIVTSLVLTMVGGAAAGASSPRPVSGAATRQVMPSSPSAAESSTSRSDPLVVLWGDSLAWESSDAFSAAVREGTEVEISSRTFGGTAPCDWLEDIEGTVAEEDVTIAVLEFSGNAFTPCMRDPVTGAAPTADRHLEAYARDLRRVLDILAADEGATSVYIVGAPAGRSEAAADVASRLRDLYERTASTRPDVVYVPAGSSVLDDDRYTESLPCLPGESAEQGCTNGRIAVRSPDGIHFCPTTTRSRAGVVESCPTWSSGAFRFGMAMAEPVRRDIHARRQLSPDHRGRALGSALREGCASQACPG